MHTNVKSIAKPLFRFIYPQIWKAVI